jgi:hypothetical protein
MCLDFTRGSPPFQKCIGVLVEVGEILAPPTLVAEWRTENPRVGGSIPPLATIRFIDLRTTLSQEF